MRFIARRIFYAPSDFLQKIKNPDVLMPPKGIIYTGAGDFLKTGKHIIGMLVTKHGLKAEHAVLDIGSGIGRLAIPLTTYLNARGSYNGFDVIELGVNWCKKNISSKYPNFNFKYVPLHNDLYTSSGEEAYKFEFPYEANSFNFALANSLFTHMMPNEVKNYYEQLYKVMQPGGKVYATFFMVSSANSTRYTSNPIFSFNVLKDNYRLMDAKVTSANIAFDEDYLFTQIINPAQFKIVYKSYGYWHNESLVNECEEYQDILVVEKI